jgi:hypothetical protein
MEFGPLVVEGLATDTSNSNIVVRDLRISKTAGKHVSSDFASL